MKVVEPPTRDAVRAEKWTLLEAAEARGEEVPEEWKEEKKRYESTFARFNTFPVRWPDVKTQFPCFYTTPLRLAMNGFSWTGWEDRIKYESSLLRNRRVKTFPSGRCEWCGLVIEELGQSLNPLEDVLRFHRANSPACVPSK